VRIFSIGFLAFAQLELYVRSRPRVILFFVNNHRLPRKPHLCHRGVYDWVVISVFPIPVSTFLSVSTFRFFMRTLLPKKISFLAHYFEAEMWVKASAFLIIYNPLPNPDEFRLQIGTLCHKAPSLSTASSSRPLAGPNPRHRLYSHWELGFRRI